jgi:hypothetical protein
MMRMRMMMTMFIHDLCFSQRVFPVQPLFLLFRDIPPMLMPWMKRNNADLSRDDARARPSHSL